MIFVTDTQYAENSALAAGVLFHRWESSEFSKVIRKEINEIAPYEPGNFYKRELPCILSLLEDVHEPIEAIVIDGYVRLGNKARDGLGMHLFKAINQSIPVIGVAKKAFLETPEDCQIIRGISIKPLFVTSVGISLETAKNRILRMHGRNRIPTQLKRVDQICRGITPNIVY